MFLFLRVFEGNLIKEREKKHRNIIRKINPRLRVSLSHLFMVRLFYPFIVEPITSFVNQDKRSRSPMLQQSIEELMNLPSRHYEFETNVPF